MIPLIMIQNLMVHLARRTDPIMLPAQTDMWMTALDEAQGTTNPKRNFSIPTNPHLAQDQEIRKRNTDRRARARRKLEVSDLARKKPPLHMCITLLPTIMEVHDLKALPMTLTVCITTSEPIGRRT